MADGPVDIAYCIDSLPPTGGTEGQLAGLIERLDRSRWRPHLVTTRAGEPTRPVRDCPHLALDVPRLAGYRALAAARILAGYLRRERVRIVHSYFQDATILGQWTARLAGVPVRLGSLRDLGFWRERNVEFLMRRTYPILTGLVANSQAVRDRFAADDGLDPRRIHVIPNGLDPGEVPYTPAVARPPRVLLIGNLNRPVKRADLFLDAAARVVAAWPEARFVLVGDGHLRPSLEARAHGLGLGGQVTFAGRVADVRPLLREAAIGVNCSDSEGFSNAVLEYMLAGCAVVATDVGGNAELVRADVDGLLVPPGDAGALAAAVARLLGDDALAARLRDSARQRVADEFSWQRTCREHEALYARLLAAAGLPGR